MKSVFFCFLIASHFLAFAQGQNIGSEEMNFFNDVIEKNPSSEKKVPEISEKEMGKVAPSPLVKQDDELSFEELKSIGYGAFDQENKEISNAEKNKKKVFYFDREQTSLIKWDQIKPEDWTNLPQWIAQRDLRDNISDWEVKVRASSHKELMGRVISSVGNCKIFRGKGFVKAHYLSSIKEGDDVITGEDGQTWIFLVDGTLVRLSPNTTMSFKEINLGVNENILHARLGEGHVLWISRDNYEFKPYTEQETDVLFLPLRLYEANYSEEEIQWSDENFVQSLEEDHSTLIQFQRLNKLISKNNNWIKNRPTYSFLVLPNGSIFGKKLNIELYYNLNSKAYFKIRSDDFYAKSEEDSHKKNSLEKEEKGEFYFRGYQNTQKEVLEKEQWYEVSERGREIKPYLPQESSFNLGELLTKRIPTLFVAREMMLEKYSKDLFKVKYDEEILAQKNGYKLWGPLFRENDKVPRSDLQLRLSFLKEFTRRLETSNLLAQDKFLSRFPESQRPKVPSRFDYTRRALSAYLSRIGQGRDKNQNSENMNHQSRIWRFKLWKVKNSAGN